MTPPLSVYDDDFAIPFPPGDSPTAPTSLNDVLLLTLPPAVTSSPAFPRTGGGGGGPASAASAFALESGFVRESAVASSDAAPSPGGFPLSTEPPSTFPVRDPESVLAASPGENVASEPTHPPIPSAAATASAAPPILWRTIILLVPARP